MATSAMRCDLPPFDFPARPIPLLYYVSSASMPPSSRLAVVASFRRNLHRACPPTAFDLLAISNSPFVFNAGSHRARPSSGILQPYMTFSVRNCVLRLVKSIADPPNVLCRCEEWLGIMVVLPVCPNGYRLHRRYQRPGCEPAINALRSRACHRLLLCELQHAVIPHARARSCYRHTLNALTPISPAAPFAPASKNRPGATSSVDLASVPGPPAIPSAAICKHGIVTTLSPCPVASCMRSMVGTVNSCPPYSRCGNESVYPTALRLHPYPPHRGLYFKFDRRCSPGGVASRVMLAALGAHRRNSVRLSSSNWGPKRISTGFGLSDMGLGGAYCPDD